MNGLQFKVQYAELEALLRETYLPGEPVLVQVLLPNWDEEHDVVLLKGCVVEVFSELADGFPLKRPVYRVCIELGRSFHSGLKQPHLKEVVEIENGALCEEPKLDESLSDDELDAWLNFLEEHPPVNELQLSTVVKCCWADTLMRWDDAYECLAFDGNRPAPEWLAEHQLLVEQIVALVADLHSRDTQP